MFFSGSVQGVGFRHTTWTIARNFDVTGYVCNLPDRRVELVAEGTPEQLEAFLTAIKERMSGLIRNVESDTRSANHEFSGFDIRY